MEGGKTPSLRRVSSFSLRWPASGAGEGARASSSKGRRRRPRRPSSSRGPTAPRASCVAARGGSSGPSGGTCRFDASAASRAPARSSPSSSARGPASLRAKRSSSGTRGQRFVARPGRAACPSSRRLPRARATRTTRGASGERSSCAPRAPARSRGAFVGAPGPAWSAPTSRSPSSRPSARREPSCVASRRPSGSVHARTHGPDVVVARTACRAGTAPEGAGTRRIPGEPAPREASSPKCSLM